MDYIYNDVIALSLSAEVYGRFLAYIDNYNFKIENGGIIVGILNPAKKMIIATDVSEPQKKDRCSAFAYRRAEFGHQEIMDKLWEESQHTKTYLGEWHTHNQRIPLPSFTDRRNWLEISRRKQNSDWLFFVIVGTEQIGIWTIASGKIVQMTKVDN
ncbi:MAG: Mov34/MPN/PAD-1 family protein [Desulfosporosinus sp.]|nr:Mov34/MPN/PAD-1 family protein [Desulfosporosinus sp.]